MGRDCPSCGHDSNKNEIEVAAKTKAEELSDRELREYFIGFRKDQCFFSYARCSSCGILYCPKYFSQEALNELYSNMPDNTTVSGEQDSERTQKGYARFFRSFHSKPKYLEIGADIGLLTREFSSRFNAIQADAIEPNLEVHERFLAGLNVPSSVYSDGTSVPVNSKYDAIAAIHVVDHLLHPMTELRANKERLLDGGQFLIVVHNEKSFLRKLLHKKWPPFCLQHPQLFNPSTISEMLQNAGLTTVKIQKTQNYLSLRQVFTLANSIGLFPRNGLSRIPEWSAPIRLGNIAIISTPAENQ